MMISPTDEGPGPGAISPIHHTPVLLDVIARDILKPEDRFIVDMTLGEGGHSAFFLQSGRQVWAVERDPAILAKARVRLAPWSDRFQVFQGVFSESAPFLATLPEGADLVLFDFGISMFHYRESGRGFSFHADEPLDMRLTPDGGESAADIVNGWREEDLADLLYQEGGETRSRPVARAIANRRRLMPFTRAKDLADVVKMVFPPPRPGEKYHHPATRTFQALRVAVNRELTHIVPGLKAAIEILRPGGRVAAIAYHSLEDRLVKETFKEFTGPKVKVNRYREVAKKNGYHLLHSKPVEADDAEVAANPAARSAKMRVLVKDDG